MRLKLYLETTIPSYLTGTPSKDVMIAGSQAATRLFWDKFRGEYDLYVSETTLQECGRGNALLARNRLQALTGIPILRENEASKLLAEKLLSNLTLPPGAAADAVHVAMAVIYGMDLLLTWNCKHLANAKLWRTMQQVVEDAGYRFVTICTPNELLGGADGDADE